MDPLLLVVLTFTVLLGLLAWAGTLASRRSEQKVCEIRRQLQPVASLMGFQWRDCDSIETFCSRVTHRVRDTIEALQDQVPESVERFVPARSWSEEVDRFFDTVRERMVAPLATHCNVPRGPGEDVSKHWERVRQVIHRERAETRQFLDRVKELEPNLETLQEVAHRMAQLVSIRTRFRGASSELKEADWLDLSGSLCRFIEQVRNRFGSYQDSLGAILLEIERFETRYVEAQNVLTALRRLYPDTELDEMTQQIGENRSADLMLRQFRDLVPLGTDQDRVETFRAALAQAKAYGALRDRLVLLTRNGDETKAPDDAALLRRVEGRLCRAGLSDSVVDAIRSVLKRYALPDEVELNFAVTLQECLDELAELRLTVAAVAALFSLPGDLERPEMMRQLRQWRAAESNATRTLDRISALLASLRGEIES